jgi:hypothetical protein
MCVCVCVCVYLLVYVGVCICWCVCVCVCVCMSVCMSVCSCVRVIPLRYSHVTGASPGSHSHEYSACSFASFSQHQCTYVCVSDLRSVRYRTNQSTLNQQAIPAMPTSHVSSHPTNQQAEINTRHLVFGLGKIEMRVRQKSKIIVVDGDD